KANGRRSLRHPALSNPVSWPPRNDNRRPVFRRVRGNVWHRRNARGVRRRGVSRALRRGRGGAGPRSGTARHRSRRRRAGDLRSRPVVAADPASLDLGRLRRETETVGYPILPLVRQLAEKAGEGGRWPHWGATTQDIMDTAAVLQIREGLRLIET